MNVAKLIKDSLSAIDACTDLQQLETCRISLLGRKGLLKLALSELGQLSGTAKAERGKQLNQAKQQLTSAITAKQAQLKTQQIATKLSSDFIDLSLPVQPAKTGRIHPISQTIDEVIAIFANMGFQLAQGPDIEDDFHNFAALNFPQHHPARDAQDTFFLETHSEQQQLLLRTHTSTVQVRTMLQQSLPIRIIAPGRCYRRDSDITHSPMFHQVEGLYVDKAVNFGHLKYCLNQFLRQYFDTPKIEVRYRASFFPFTEPSCEIDIGYTRQGEKITIGKGDDWLEILGCGMVHPQVLTNCGIDAEIYTGFAFGMGLERIAMLKYGIPDLRAFFNADCRWLQHYGFSPFLQTNLVHGLAG